LHESDYLFNYSYIQACLAGFTIYHAARFVGSLLKGCMFSFTGSPGHHAGKNFMGGYCYLNNAIHSTLSIVLYQLKEPFSVSI
jgi:acetoin utilization deacetylase AcuC-like enzyme